MRALRESPGCRFEPANAVELDWANKTATAGAVRTPSPDQVSALNALVTQESGASLPADYIQWLAMHDGFNIICEGGTPMQIHGVASALLLYQGAGTLDSSFVEIGTDNGGLLYTIDLKNKWGRGNGAIWLVAMDDPEEPYYGAPTFEQTVALVMARTKLYERGWEVTPEGGGRRAAEWGIQKR